MPNYVAKPFKTLDQDDYTAIAKLRFEEMKARLAKERQIEVILDDSGARLIGAYCHFLKEGARAVRRVLRAVVLLPVSRFMLEKNRTPPARVRVKAVYPGGDVSAEPEGQVDWA